MLKEKLLGDSIMLGALAGAVGNVVKLAIAWSLYGLGVVQHLLVHAAASYFVPLGMVSTAGGLILGHLVDFTVAAVFGVILVYILRHTGRDFAILKGLGLGMLTFIALYGGLTAGGLTEVDPKTPGANLALLVPHLALGAVAGWFIERYGDL